MGTLALGLLSLAIGACGRYPDEARAYHVERFSPDVAPRPLIAPTPTPPSPPPLLGGAALFTSRSAAPEPSLTPSTSSCECRCEQQSVGVGVGSGPSDAREIQPAQPGR